SERARRRPRRAHRVRRRRAQRGRAGARPRARVTGWPSAAAEGDGGVVEEGVTDRGRAQARAIAHVDMDAFYAAIEQRDRSELRGKPVIVGADPKGRGVVSAASYEARTFGVRSAMPIGRAARLCPHAAFVRPDMEKYGRVSAEIMAILDTFSPLVEAVSVDEAFVDLTGTGRLHGSPLP